MRPPPFTEEQRSEGLGTTLRLLDQNTKWENSAELYVGLMEEAARKDIMISSSPLVLWDYVTERQAAIISLTARDLFQLQGSNPHTVTLSEEGDISHFCPFFGMSGFITIMILLQANSHLQRLGLVESLAQLRMRVMG